MTLRAARIRSALRASGHHARVAGENGRPVLFLHSLGLDSREFALLANQLRPDLCCVAVDLLGHGSDPSENPTLEEMAVSARAALAVIADIAETQPIVVGHSMGGAVAAEVARCAPELVASLGLVGTPPRGFPVFAERAVQMSSVPRSIVIQETLERWFRPETLRMAAAPVTYARDCLRRLPESVWESAWTSFAAWPGPSVDPSLPVWLVAGEDDVSTPATAMRDLRPGVEPEVIPAAAHMLPLEQPAVLAYRIRALSENAR